MRVKRGAPDFAIILSVMLLISIGIIMVFSSSAVTSQQTSGDPYHFLKKQTLWAALGILAMYTVSHIDYFRLKKVTQSLVFVFFS